MAVLLSKKTLRGRRIVIQFARLGPYHLARINSAVKGLSASGWEVIALETAVSDNTYKWEKETSPTQWERRTVFSDEVWESIPARKISQGIYTCLDELQPDAIAIAGWGSPDARACLKWCQQNGATSIVMSETREADGRRTWWKEQVKKRLVRQFDAGFIGGLSHRDYLIKLGIPAGKIQFGYNVVDNNYFTSEADCCRQEDSSLNLRPYFLASNRFIERKNLKRLITAYSEASKNPSAGVSYWNLCLLGDGQLMSELKAHSGNSGLRVADVAPWKARQKDENKPVVFFPGFRQIEELPRFYANAGCFVHPALEEPWGLVINEAMACGLPILSSANVGAGEELVDDGVNGWTFDPADEDQIAEAMNRIGLLPTRQLQAMGQASARILEERCPTDAFGQGLVELLREI